MEAKVLDVIASITKLDKGFLVEHKGEQKQWDSLKNIEIVLALEESFDIFFDSGEIAEMTSTHNIISIVSTKVSE
jgi:acyl carrier protein